MYAYIFGLPEKNLSERQYRLPGLEKAKAGSALLATNGKVFGHERPVPSTL
jgi:hypothetical protein